jgi:hypothetical protein
MDHEERFGPPTMPYLRRALDTALLLERWGVFACAPTTEQLIEALRRADAVVQETKR